jgi:hypothetical protein
VKTVLIVDSDLRFAFWLGHALDEAGYYALSAACVKSATRLLAELGMKVDLVVIGVDQPGAAGFLAELRRTQNRLMVIALLDEPEPPPATFPRADLDEYKPLSIDEEARREWIDTVQMVLAAKASPRWRSWSTPQ